MKRPAFQFYPADWQKDAALQSCSIAARGLWIEMMCIMHQCEPYGHLSVNSSPMTTVQLARLVGEPAGVVKRLLAELEAAGVFSRLEDGAPFSRRMVKDERIRNVRAEAGKQGGNPNLLGDKVKQMVKQTDNHTDKQSPTPSSSSSLEVQKHVPPDGGFVSFWKAWPSTSRKQGKSECLRLWRKQKLEPIAEQIVAHVEAMKNSSDWRNGYDPLPATYLRQARWDGAEATAEPEKRMVM